MGGRLRGGGEVPGTTAGKQRPAFGVRTGKASKYSPKPSSLFSASSARHHPWGPLGKYGSPCPALGSALALLGGHFGQD